MTSGREFWEDVKRQEVADAKARVADLEERLRNQSGRIEELRQALAEAQAELEALRAATGLV